MGENLSNYYWQVLKLARIQKNLHYMCKFAVVGGLALVLIAIVQFKLPSLFNLGIVAAGYMLYRLTASTANLFEGPGFEPNNSPAGLTVRELDSWDELPQILSGLVAKREVEISPGEYEELQALIDREGLDDARTFIAAQLNESGRVTYSALTKVLIYSEGKRHHLEQQDAQVTAEEVKQRLSGIHEQSAAEVEPEPESSGSIDKNTRKIVLDDNPDA
jgi:hypothetical protein